MSAETVELNLLALQSRKDEIVHRLQQIAVPVFKVQPKKKAQIASPSDVVNVVPVIAGKTDTHWDFLLKEMQWLAADFQAERKRHAGLSKKLAVSVAAFAANAEARHHRSLQEAEMKRRKLAARISRDCLKSWSKIDRVISYKQKVSYDVSRQAAMDQQLVQLVQQTEKYTLFLGADDPDSSILTIEQALASTERRRSKHLVRDYTRLLLEQKTSGGETSLYGESTEDSGSDATFSLDVDDDNSDDESTLRAAELEERRERKQQGDDFYEDDTRSFVADPVELRKLQEEGEMELEKVLQRLREEGESGRTHLEIQKSDESNEKRVQFAVAIEDVVIDNKVSMKPVAARRAPDPGSDADDDMDASDVEDYQDAMEEDDQDDEFVADDEEVDDETTLDKEEMLPQEITELEEIQLLEQENELTIEELRKRYAVVLAAPMRETNEDATALQYDYSGFKPAANGSANAYLTSGAVSTVDQPQSKVEEIIAASEDEASGSDFVRLADDVGDEFVLGNEVTTGRNLPCNDELEHLKVENEIPIEHMRAIDHRRNDNFYEDVESEADNLIGDDPVLLSTTQLLADGSLTGDADSSEEYEDEEAFDDEKTMEAEEKLGRDMSYEEEIAMLDRENEMSIDELRAMYTQKEEEVDEEDDVLDDKEALIENSNTSQLASDSPRSIDDQENDGDFSPDEDIEDDELTIAAEERLGREISAEEEITMLQKESELPVDEFRSMYQMLAEGTRDIDSLRPSSTMKRKRREEADADDKKRLKHQDAGVEIIDKFEVSATLAKSTIASRPFLIPAWVKLREYQHIGLNWLVSLQSRRLNGILADGKPISFV